MKYAVFFLACSVGLVFIAFPWTASSVLKLWGSLALGVVGLGYAGVGPRIFGKVSDGRMRRKATAGRHWSLLPFCWLGVTCRAPPKRSSWCSGGGPWPE